MDDQLSREELWYIQHYGKCDNPSEIGKKTALVLTKLFGGMHHVPTSQIEKMDWDNDRYLTFSYGGSMATFDDNLLTRLVLLAHEHCVRVEIKPCNFKYFTIDFYNRKGREGMLYERHPTIKQAGLEEIIQ